MREAGGSRTGPHPFREVARPQSAIGLSDPNHFAPDREERVADSLLPQDAVIASGEHADAVARRVHHELAPGRPAEVRDPMKPHIAVGKGGQPRVATVRAGDIESCGAMDDDVAQPPAIGGARNPGRQHAHALPHAWRATVARCWMPLCSTASTAPRPHSARSHPPADSV